MDHACTSLEDSGVESKVDGECGVQDVSEVS